MNRAPVEDQRSRRMAPTRAVLSLVVAALATLVATLSPTSAGTPSFLWKATDTRGTVYLVGSVHMLSKDYYPLSPAFEAAFKVSDLLVEELDFGSALAPDSQLKLLSRGMLPSGQSLDSVVSAETFAIVSRRLTNLGMPVEPLKRFKPWALALTLLALEWQQTGFDPSLGLDKHFHDRARAEGKAIQALETVDFQISRFDEMSAEDQDRLLASAIKDIDAQKQSLLDLVSAWKVGDAPRVEQVVLRDLKREPALYERLLVERNRNWMPLLEPLFARPGTAFVVVGAAHLVGPDGLLAMFKARGYTVVQQ
jgi:uncharacterized protein YbaP (TraB family)